MIALGIKEFAKAIQTPDCIIIDTRLPDYFENGFIQGSINIPYHEQFEKHLKILKEGSTLVFIFKPGTENNAINIINNTNLKVLGFLKGGFDTWLNHYQNYDMIISISSEELVLNALYNTKAVILDVRSNEEYKNKHIKEAINIPLHTLFSDYNKLNPLSETLIYCQNGFESMIAASFLKRQGFKNIKHVWGGFNRINVEPKAILQKG